MKLPGLKAARTEKRLTQEELAQKSGLTSKTVSNIENGFTTRFKSADKLARALGVKVERLEQEGAAA